MRRSVRFWTRYTWESMGVVLGAMVILTVISLLGADRTQMAQFAAQLPYLLCVSAIFGMMMLNTGSQTLYVPLLLSMGETRRNVLLGFHYYRVLIIAATVGLCGLVWLAAPGNLAALGLRSLPSILCILTAVSSLGSMMGTIFIRVKWLGTILIVLLCGGAGGLIGMTGAAAANGGFSAGIMEKLAGYLVKTPWWLAAIALGLLAADVLFQWELLRRQEVRL